MNERTEIMILHTLILLSKLRRRKCLLKRGKHLVRSKCQSRCSYLKYSSPDSVSVSIKKRKNGKRSSKSHGAGAGGDGLVTVVAIGGVVVGVDRDALQDGTNHQADRPDQNANEPEPPAEVHRASKRPQELDDNHLERGGGAGYRREDPTVKNAGENIDLLHLPAVHLVENLVHRTGRRECGWKLCKLCMAT
jgi:hypothetical protein